METGIKWNVYINETLNVTLIIETFIYWDCDSDAKWLRANMKVSETTQDETRAITGKWTKVGERENGQNCPDEPLSQLLGTWKSNSRKIS